MQSILPVTATVSTFLHFNCSVINSYLVMLHTLLEKWPEMYGEIYRFFIGSRSVVVLSAPELAEVFFKEIIIHLKRNLS